MSKPKTKDEAYLREKFAHEDEINYEIEAEVRKNKRIWKRQTSKLHRKMGKEQIRQQLEGDDE